MEPGLGAEVGSKAHAHRSGVKAVPTSHFTGEQTRVERGQGLARDQRVGL